MRTYQTQEIALSIPEKFVDRSVNVFSMNPDGPSEFSYVISRDQMKAGETLESYIARQVDALKKQIATLKIHQNCQISVEGRAAGSLDLSWTAQGKALVQWQVIVARTATDILAFTATCEIEHAARWQPVFQEMVQSIKWVDHPNQA